jgi:hypothetical protein
MYDPDTWTYIFITPAQELANIGNISAFLASWPVKQQDINSTAIKAFCGDFLGQGSWKDRPLL